MKYFLTVSTILLLTISGVTNSIAKDYSKTMSKYVSCSAGSAKAGCKATYHSSGTIRWTPIWMVIDASSLKAAYATETYRYIPTDRHMITKGKISMTSYNYTSGSANLGYDYKFNGSSVTASDIS